MRHFKPTESERKKSLGGIVRARSHILRKVIGDAINAKGRVREEKVLTALSVENASTLAPWFVSAERACGKDDARGIDIVVYSDVGKLFLQVKGSPKAVQEFLRKHPKGNIVPFLVRDDECTQSLRKRLIEALGAERQRILDLRKR